MGKVEGVGPRCACAAVSGILVALAVSAVNSTAGFYMVSLPCTPAGSLGCAIGKFFAGMFLAVMLHLLLLLAVAMAAGGLLGWLAFRLLRIQVAMPLALSGPLVLLDAIGYAHHLTRSEPLELVVFLTLAAIGYTLAALVTTPALGRKRPFATIGLVAVGIALLALS